MRISQVYEDCGAVRYTVADAIQTGGRSLIGPESFRSSSGEGCRHALPTRPQRPADQCSRRSTIFTAVNINGMTKLLTASVYTTFSGDKSDGFFPSLAAPIIFSCPVRTRSAID